MTDLAMRFIEPLDVLILRGNRLFGDPGSYGESQMPPWPSVVSGALRSRILADTDTDLMAFARGEVDHPSLGTPRQPGAFYLADLQVVRRRGEEVEMLFPLPADLSITGDEYETLQIRRLEPQALIPALRHSGSLPRLPILAETIRSKPVSGYWLRESGWTRHLQGQLPQREDLVPTNELWQMDERVGVGLSAEQRSAASGKLFTTQAIALRPGVGFLAAVHGAAVPEDGLLRLGGDGRAAAIRGLARSLPEPDYAAIAAARRCRILLTSPGIFPGGWVPPGVDPQADFLLSLPGIRAQLVAAAASRAEIVSGWDLARWQPKTAQRAVSQGAVYWLENLETTPEALRKFITAGWWGDSCEDRLRRAEGFNRCTLAAW
jgi:CRISPR-associated protein Cmr3